MSSKNLEIAMLETETLAVQQVVLMLAAKLNEHRSQIEKLIESDDGEFSTIIIRAQQLAEVANA